MYVHHYDTIDTMLSECEEACAAGRVTESRNLNHGARWIGHADFRTWGDFKSAANGVWTEGQEIIDRMLSEIGHVELPTPVSTRRRPRWAEEGDDFDRDRLMSGNLECWRTVKRQNTRQPKPICLIVNVGATGDRTSEEMMWRGVVSVVLADLLENAGYQVEFWAASHGRGRYEDRYNEITFSAVCMKRSGQPLDKPTLINAISSWFYRIGFFQSYHTRKDVAPSGGYGSTVVFSGEMEGVKELAGNADTLVIDGIWSQSAAVAKIREVVAMLNDEVA